MGLGEDPPPGNTSQGFTVMPVAISSQPHQQRTRSQGINSVTLYLPKIRAKNSHPFGQPRSSRHMGWIEGLTPDAALTMH